MSKSHHSRSGGAKTRSALNAQRAARRESAANNPVIDHLDLWNSVYVKKAASGRGSNGKISPYGIQKLRELILELAVRGKLVSQDPNDEPASVLLEKISKEEARLVKEGLIKKPKKFPEIQDDEKSIELPDSWAWIRVRRIGHDWGQKKPDKDFSYIDVSAIDNHSGKVIAPSVLLPAEAPSRARKIVKKGTVIYSTVRPYLKNIAVVEEVFDPEPIASTAFAIIHPYAGIPGDYLVAFFRSPVFVRYVESVQTGIAYPAINDKQFYGSVFPLPPLAEQHRIVTKVDELMALCDQLEQQQTNSLEAHQTLVEALLRTLVDADSAESAQQAWNRIAEHFDTLFTTEESIDQLKQTIFQLAVMGKLVPQDLNDEPANVLLEKIAEEKIRLVETGRIKKPKKLIDFQGLDELKGIIPNRWVYARLADAADIVRGGSPRPAGDPRFYGGDIPFLKVADVSRASGKLVEGYNATIKEAGLNKTRYIDKRTVLLTNSGATLGIPAICDFPATFNDGIAAFVELSEFVFDEYLHLYLKALSKWFIEIASRGQGQPNLNTDIIKATWFALPPLNEQHRIVAKVDELLAICNALKSRIQDAQATQVHLADAVVDQAVA